MILIWERKLGNDSPLTDWLDETLSQDCNVISLLWFLSKGTFCFLRINLSVLLELYVLSPKDTNHALIRLKRWSIRMVWQWMYANNWTVLITYVHTFAYVMVLALIKRLSDCSNGDRSQMWVFSRRSTADSYSTRSRSHRRPRLPLSHLCGKRDSFILLFQCGKTGRCERGSLPC